MRRHYLSAAALAAIISGSVTSGQAGEESMTLPPPPMAPTPEAGSSSAFSGSLSFDANTHFISYGADIWGAGNNFDEALFNPSLELAWDLGNDVSFTLGTWWDVNDNAVSSIGKNVQEVDVWAGISYSGGPVDISLTYQQWYYAEETEQIVDLSFGFGDVPLSPSLTIHGRVDPGASGGDNGVVPVLGIELPGFSLGAAEFSFPVSVAFATDGFHGGDAGFAYASAGAGVSVPLPIMEVMGDWALNAGVTYYYTDEKVIPNNPDESFFTGSIGIGLSF